MSDEIIIVNGLETRTWTYKASSGYGCAECCWRDRCDDDCTAKYYRPECPHCKGKGWIDPMNISGIITNNPINMENKYTPCGGCGATEPIQRCIGCFHPFEPEEKKYPIGGYAPGSYQCHCGTCGESFRGDKQAVQCEPCALEAKARFDALPIEEQMQLIKRNGQIAQVMFECPVSPERDLILRIVEQWGNVIQMPKMEQWLKDYAATKGPTSAVWVKASERLPEFDSPLPLKIDSLYRMGNFYHEEGKNKLYVQGPEPYILYEDKFGGVEWLDESGTPTAGREESDAVDHEFIDFIVNERDAISKEMLSDTWWLEIPAAKRVVFENVLVAYDQMVERLKKEK